MDVTKLIAVARKVAGLLPGGPEALAAGEAVLELADSVAPTLAEADQKALQQGIAGLIEKMDRDVDAALAALKGK